MPKKKLYIGCPLTDLPVEIRVEYLMEIDRLKGILADYFEILSFLGTTAGTSDDVYQRDIKECIGTADFFLAFCDYSATGVGYEMGTAVEKRGIPTLAVVRSGNKVTRLIKGIDHENYLFAWYDSIEHVANMEVEFFGVTPTS